MKLNKCKTIIILIALVAQGCLPMGVYLSTGSSAAGYLKLKFYRNKTFLLQGHYDIGGKFEETGKWYLKRKKLFLHLDTIYKKEEELQIFYDYIPDLEFSNIQILGFASNDISITNILVNDSIHVHDHKENKGFYFKTKTIQNIDISYIETETGISYNKKFNLPMNSNIAIITKGNSRFSYQLPKDWEKKCNKIISKDTIKMSFVKKY